jgi:hypothetical protein
MVTSRCRQSERDIRLSRKRLASAPIATSRDLQAARDWSSIRDRHAVSQPLTARPDAILRLQRVAGNRGVQRLLESHARRPEGPRSLARSGKVEGVPGEEEMVAFTGRDRPPKAEGSKPRLEKGTVSGPEAFPGDGSLTAQTGVEYKTLSGPTRGTCGGFNWPIQWVLDKKSKKGGWIVQHVRTTFDVKDCAGNQIDVKSYTSGGIDPGWWPLWEAWQVNPGKKITTYAEGGDPYDDTYVLGNDPGKTRGTMKIVGRAEFYEGLTLPSAFKVLNQPPAGILPVTTTDPGLTGGTGMIHHDLTARWNCCPGKDKKVKDDRTKIKVS